MVKLCITVCVVLMKTMDRKRQPCEIQGGMRRCNCSIKCVEHNSDICCKVLWLQLN